MVNAIIELNPEGWRSRRHGPGTENRSCARPAAWDPGRHQRQHRDGRPDGDVGGIAGAGSRITQHTMPSSFTSCAKPARCSRAGRISANGPNFRSTIRPAAERPRRLYEKIRMCSIAMPAARGSGTGTAIAAKSGGRRIGTETDGSVVCLSSAVRPRRNSNRRSAHQPPGIIPSRTVRTTSGSDGAHGPRRSHPPRRLTGADERDAVTVSSRTKGHSTTRDSSIPAA